MKKIIVLALAFALCFIFTCCGKDSDDSIKPVEPASAAKPELNFDYEMDFSIEPIEPASAAKPELNFDYEMDFSIEPIEPVSAAKPTFDFANVEGLFEDMIEVEAFEPADIEFFIQAKDDLVANLATAFANAGINVDINRETGEMSVDSTVLFGGDSAVLSEEGKDFLNKFISAYTSVVCTDTFDGLISKLMVEGHTAPVAGTSYEDDIPLSQERADNVKSYCLSSDTGLSAEALSELSATMEAKGLSNGTPVKDSAGNVDMDASRRVAFRFLFDPNA